MDKHFSENVYDLQYRDDGSVMPPCCLACMCYEGESRARARRRCKSEGLERSPYDVIPCPVDWQKISRNQQYISPYAVFSERQEPRLFSHCQTDSKVHVVKSSNNIRETKISSHSPVRPSQHGLVQYGVCNINGDSLNSRSRRSPVKQVCSNIVVCNGRRNICCEKPYKTISPSKFIENEEPRLSELEEFKDTLVQIVNPRPNSTDFVQYNKTPLKSILVSNSRRSASPTYYRKTTKGKPPSDWSEVNGKQTVEGKRRVRARSESEKNVCLVANDSCKYGSCCSTVLKRARGKSPPPLSVHQSHSTKELGIHCSPYSNTKHCSATSNSRRNQPVQCRDIGVGEWSVFDGVTVASSYRSQHPTKPASSKGQLAKGKQPSAKVKSKLQAIKAKKASMETCSTGSELSDDELSDAEDGASKASMDRDSDISVEPADHQECLTSDSGPSVSSVSDSASLNGLTSALSVGAVVSQDQDWVQAMLRPSLFPLVPPYLRFNRHDSAPVRPPMAVQRHLRWKLTTITPVVVRRTLLASGFKLVRKSMEWMGTWGKHMKSICFKTLKDSQKMNHFPGTFQIGRKDRLWRNLHKLMAKFGIREFGLMPKTYVLPHDLKALKHDWEKYAAQNEKWIIKPPASARGTGIKVVSRWTQIPKRRPVVVQRYISRPLLIDGSKFDMRLYVLVTSVHPLRIYLYPDGLARFASVKYSDENNSLHDRYMHLTNYSINRLSKSYTHNQDAEACQGHKWTLQALLSYLRKERGMDTDKLWSSMKDLVIKTIISGESSISCLTKSNLGSRFNCYELFGIDVLLDENLKPWLLEVNISPSLHSASPLDLHVKGPLVSTLLNMAQFHMPDKVNVEGLAKEKGPYLHDKRLYTVHLSKEEKLKHTYFTEIDNRMDYISDILTNLTPDDVRHLIQYEDEYTQKNNLERIFPTADTSHYLDFFAGPRYYNRLFDAWESRYANNRMAGIKRLQDLCEGGYHLEVPPTPAKNDEEELSETKPPPEPTPCQSIDTSTQESVMESAAPDASLDRGCSLRGGHIVGEICLVCRPVGNILQQECQPLPVQQHA